MASFLPNASCATHPSGQAGRKRPARTPREASMTGSHFKRIGVGALAVAALSLTACGGAASGGGAGGSGTPSQTLTVGYDSDPAPQGYDPLLYGSGQRMFYESLYQSLFVETSTG